MQSRGIIMLVLSLTGFMTHAQGAPVQPLSMVLLENYVSENADQSINIESLIFQRLQQLALPDIQISSLILSNKRAEELLMGPGQYCSMSKIKSTEREKYLQFADTATSIYPPLQLISLNRGDSEPVDLAALLQKKPAVKIGVVNGRTYGKDIDHLIQSYPQHFFRKSGNDSAQNLSLMLQKGRLDAIIEFAAIVRNSVELTQDSKAVSAAPIKGQPVIRGYIACQKGALGSELIQRMNKKMQDPAYKADVLRYHKEYFSSADYKLIDSALQAEFRPLQDRK